MDTLQGANFFTVPTLTGMWIRQECSTIKVTLQEQTLILHLAMIAQNEYTFLLTDVFGKKHVCIC